MSEPFVFDLPQPHVYSLTVNSGEIDAYNHVNNAVYVTWCDRTAWHHSAMLGLPIERCLELDRGMAVVRSLITYIKPALLDDRIEVATWLLPAASRLCVRRRFQVIRVSDHASHASTLARAEIDYACIELSTGRPTRWPPEFKTSYQPLAAVIAAYESVPPL